MAITRGEGHGGWNFYPHVKMKRCGNQVDFMLTDRKSDAPLYTRVNDEWFIDGGGVLRRFDVSRHKGQNLDSVKRSFARLRDIINCNATEPENILFVTYTYDPKRLQRGTHRPCKLGKIIAPLDLRKVSNDMRNCHKRWRDAGYSFEYIYTVEQQGNGNWHQHELMFFDHRAPWVEQCQLEAFWRHGFVRISKRFDTGEEFGNVGAYVCADMTFGENVGEHGRVKAERLKRYPSGARLYRCSKGIRRPDVVELRYCDYIKEANRLGQPYYEKERVMKFGASSESWRWYRYEHYTAGK